MVSYTPPYKLVSYFPALGEIFITIGLIATLMFAYRVVVFIFPVLGAHPKKMSPTLLALFALGTLLMFQASPPAAQSAETTLQQPLPLEEHQTPSVADAPKMFILNKAVINKYSDMSSILEKPDKQHDVHMGVSNGGLDFRGQDCHKTRNHMISGRSISVPAVEGDISCEYCHTDTPHIGRELIDHHLNKHTKHVACQTCHIPIYSKGNPTKIFWDWSTAGQDCEVIRDKYGKPDYAKKKGGFQWKEAVKPTYFWYNGTVKRHLLGDRVNEDGPTDLTEPVGSINDPASRIYPFKLHRGKQISDSVYKYLIAPQLWGGYWKHWDWDKAARDGMKLVYKGIDFKRLADAGMDVGDLIGITNYLDYQALVYPGDPIETAGRFDKLMLTVGRAAHEE